MGEFPGGEFYEPFGQATYWERQEVRTHLPADGRYFIVVADEGRDGKYALAIGPTDDFSGENLLAALPMAWLETKLFVDDYISLGIFSVLAAVPAVAALAVIRKKSRQSISRI